MTGSRTGTHARTLALAPAPQPPTARLRGPVCVCARARVRTCVRASVRAHRSRVAPPAQRRTHAVLIAPYCALLCLAGTALHARHAYCALLRLIVSSRHSNARRPCSAQTRSRQVRSNPPPCKTSPKCPCKSVQDQPQLGPQAYPHTPIPRKRNWGVGGRCCGYACSLTVREQMFPKKSSSPFLGNTARGRDGDRRGLRPLWRAAGCCQRTAKWHVETGAILRSDQGFVRGGCG